MNDNLLQCVCYRYMTVLLFLRSSFPGLEVKGYIKALRYIFAKSSEKCLARRPGNGWHLSITIRGVLSITIRGVGMVGIHLVS